MAIINLGNVVGMLRDTVPPATKPYLIWGKILNPANPDIVKLHTYKGTGDPALEANWEVIGDGVGVGIFLPLAGGTMTGDIEMTAGTKIKMLPSGTISHGLGALQLSNTGEIFINSVGDLTLNTFGNEIKVNAVLLDALLTNAMFKAVAAKDGISTRLVNFNKFIPTGSANNATLQTVTLTDFRQYLLQDKDGTIAFLADAVPVPFIATENSVIEIDLGSTISVELEVLGCVDGMTDIDMTGVTAYAITNLQVLAPNRIGFDIEGIAVGDYDLVITNGDNVNTDWATPNGVALVKIEASTTIIPTTTPSIPTEAWQGITGAATVGVGTFQGEASNGNGWNDGAFFGGVGVVPTSYVEIQFEIDTPVWSSNYCHVRLNTASNIASNGEPRLYLQNGTLRVYGQVDTTIGNYATGDVIKMRLTSAGLEVWKNGTSVHTDTGAYTLNNVFATFTSYRGINLKNIKMKFA